jgi:hypothetical protein
MLTSLASYLTAATKCNPYIKLSQAYWNHSTAKKLKNSPVQTQGESSPFTKLANYSEMYASDLQEASSG